MYIGYGSRNVQKYIHFYIFLTLRLFEYLAPTKELRGVGCELSSQF
jgi:hypothetical protein